MPWANENLQLDSFLKRVDELPKDSSKIVYIIIIDNIPMLTLAFGHRETNAYINKLCDKIANSKDFNCELFRIQSDQITLILDTESPEEIIVLDQEIKNLIRKFGGTNKGQKLHISSSVNYSILRESNADDILNRVYTKALNGSPESAAIIDSSVQKDRSLNEMDLANQIEEAISGDRLKFAYQPIISSKNGEVSHYECLLRLQNEKGELESAGTFIPIAERMGFIDVIDILTLKMALDKLESDKDIHLALNISNLTIGNSKWIKTFFDNINEDTASRLIIEITETAASRNMRDTAFFIASLQETGCTIALDDFGSGYTSFRQIGALSIDMVKLDGSLIKGIENNHDNQLLVKSLLNFLKGLGLKTVAEYVDTGAAAKLLMDYQIDYMQGNYFGEAIEKIE